MKIIMRLDRINGHTDIGWYYIVHAPLVLENGAWNATLIEDHCPTLSNRERSAYICSMANPMCRHVHVSKDADGNLSSPEAAGDCLKQLAMIVDAQIAHYRWFAAGKARQVHGGRLTGGVEPKKA